MRELAIRRLGTVPYGEALALQRALVEDRRAGRIPDTLLLLQHPPVITLGTRPEANRAHIVASPERLAALGVDVYETGRGGDVTYHGPGQIVGYPILDLKPDRCDVHRYVRDLEEVMIRVCVDYGVAAVRLEGLTGAWVGATREGATRGDAARRDAAKIGAIGVRISRWITSHGFAFNVATDLEHFQLIVPCGIADRGVTSLERAAGRTLSLGAVEDAFVRHFADVFERDVAFTPLAAAR